MATTLGGCHFCFAMLSTYFLIQFINEARWKLFPRKVTLAEVQFLEKHFFYFSRLKPKFKREFILRLEEILSTKRFLPKGDLKKVTPEMEILIGATMTMVLFGWKELKLMHFHSILIYPETYFSTINETYHRGEVNPRHGLIVVSWRCFVEGFIDPTDGINLGIHEIAHALKLSNWIRTDGEKEFNPKSWADYAQWVPAEIERLRTGESSFFRKSAGLNEHEFFAVALESFFERSQDLKNYHPKLYQSLVHLLRQDPLVLLM